MLGSVWDRPGIVLETFFPEGVPPPPHSYRQMLGPIIPSGASIPLHYVLGGEGGYLITGGGDYTQIETNKKTFLKRARPLVSRPKGPGPREPIAT